MQLTLLKCKIHRATVTESDLNYEGSISIDLDFMEQAGLLEFEQVDVLNVNNGERLTTYVLEGARGSGIIGLNGAAARKGMKGDKVIIAAYCGVDANEAKQHKPVLLLMGENNTVSEVI